MTTPGRAVSAGRARKPDLAARVAEPHQRALAETQPGGVFGMDQRTRLASRATEPGVSVKCIEEGRAPAARRGGTAVVRFRARSSRDGRAAPSCRHGRPDRSPVGLKWKRPSATGNHRGNATLEASTQSTQPRAAASSQLPCPTRAEWRRASSTALIRKLGCWAPSRCASWQTSSWLVRHSS